MRPQIQVQVEWEEAKRGLGVSELEGSRRASEEVVLVEVIWRRQ